MIRQRKPPQSPPPSPPPQSSLLFYHQIPPWQQDNHFIRSGYYPPTNSITKSIGSLSTLNNESVNIYSHLIPSVLVLGSITYFLKFKFPLYEKMAIWEVINVYQFGIAVTLCLFMSSTFHCIKNHSHKVSRFGNTLDYLGIILLITCSLLSIVFFALYDEPMMKYGFLIIFLGLALGCIVFIVDPTFSSSEYRPFRAGMFIIFGLSGALPVLISLRKFGYDNTYERCGLNWLILEGVFYIFGAVLYALRIPERFTHIEQDESTMKRTPAVGMFDIFGHAHQIFHVFVVIAAYCHWEALIQCCRYFHKN